MRSLDIRNVLHTALEKVEQSRDVREDEPALVELKATLIRSMAELELARQQRLASTAESGTVTIMESPEEGRGEDSGSPMAPAA